MRKRIRVIKWWTMGIVIVLLLCSYQLSLSVVAKDSIIEERNQIMTASDNTDARETPDENSAVLHSYQAGDSVYVTGETKDGWYQITYQNVIGYVPVSSLSEMDLDVEGLDAEFGAEAEEGKLVVEVVERKRAEVRRNRIWGTIIVILVVGIFALGIFSTVKANKADGDLN